jgi:hypothetical protein
VRVLVACEFSGRVRDQIALRGHVAVSCDLLPSETPGRHVRGDVLSLLDDGWDMMLAFPPCTYLTRAGSRFWKDPTWHQRQLDAADFVRRLWAAPIQRICIENPPGYLSTVLGPRFQTVQPWHFDEPYTKLTCLWLKGLPPLMTGIHHRGRISWTEKNNPRSKQRSARRSRTFPGIARAMAEQWA